MTLNCNKDKLKAYNIVTVLYGAKNEKDNWICSFLYCRWNGCCYVITECFCGCIDYPNMSFAGI